jgi:hypothetical protein
MTVTRAAQNHSGGAAIPARPSSLGRLGSWSYQHRRLVAAAWPAWPAGCLAPAGLPSGVKSTPTGVSGCPASQ